jgi:hypothetical protein
MRHRDGRHRTVLHHLAGIEHGHAVRHLGDHTQVVGDHQHRRAQLALEPLDQLQNLGLDGDVQGRGGLVGDDQAGPAGEGHGDHGPLAHAPGELAGVFPQPLLGGGDAHQAQHVRGLLPGLPAVRMLVQPDGFDDLVPDGIDRVQGAHGLLKDHGDLVAPDAAQLLRFLGQQVLSLEEDLSGLDAAGRGHEPEDGQGGDALAAARLPDHGQGLALADADVHTVHRPDQAVVGVETGLQVFHFQQRSGHASSPGGNGVRRDAVVSGGSAKYILVNYKGIFARWGKTPAGPAAGLSRHPRAALRRRGGRFSGGRRAAAPRCGFPGGPKAGRCFYGA